MAIKSVKLKIRIRTGDGKRSYVDPVYEAKARVLNHAVCLFPSRRA